MPHVHTCMHTHMYTHTHNTHTHTLRIHTLHTHTLRIHTLHTHTTHTYTTHTHTHTHTRMYTHMHILIHMKYIFLLRFVKRFEWPLLAQSIIMIVTMLMLLHLCVRVSYEKDSVMVVQRRFLGTYVKVTTHVIDVMLQISNFSISGIGLGTVITASVFCVSV